MITQLNGFLLDEQKGDFTDETGRKVEYHNARFYDTEAKKLVKVSIPKESNALPEEQVNCCVTLRVKAGEKFCKLVYDSYQL